MQPVEYVFRIDVFTPDTMPMNRLAEYLAALAKLLGHAEHTHFVRVEEGSAKIVHKVDAVDAPKVHHRLNSFRNGQGVSDAVKAHKELENLLANDNAIGSLIESDTGQIVVPFLGRNRVTPMSFPPFREHVVIQGQIISIGGRDTTAHAQLQDGEAIHTNLSMNRDIAKQLAPLLYGPIVRLHGSGRFERQVDGVWKMLNFQVESFERLNDSPIKDALGSLRDIAGNKLMSHEAYWESRKWTEGGDEA